MNLSKDFVVTLNRSVTIKRLAVAMKKQIQSENAFQYSFLHRVNYAITKPHS